MKKVTTIFLVCLLLFSCTKLNRDKIVDKSELLGDDYRLFQNTPAWELAKAVEDGDRVKINQILYNDKKLINYQEAKLGSTLLMLTIRNQQYKSFEILLSNEPDLTIHNFFDGSTCLIEACSFKQYDIKFVKDLLKNGADINEEQIDIEKEGKTRTALIVASKTGRLDFVKLLVENGANINYQNQYKQSALSEATMQTDYEIVFYLLKKGADYKQPIFYREEEKRSLYLVDVLRESIVDFDTDEYKYKKKIISFLGYRGIDYKKAPIPKYIREKIKNRYPNNWKGYLEKY